MSVCPLLPLLTLGLAAPPGAPVPATAPAPVEASSALSLDACLERARSRSPLLRRARAESAVVAARRVGADLLVPANPQVGLSLGPGWQQPGNAATLGLGGDLHAEQTFEVGGARPARQAAADRALDVARVREELAWAETRARVRAVFLAAQVAQAHRAAAAERTALGRQLVQSVLTRVAAGAASDIELRLAEAEAGRAERERLDAELGLADALGALAVLLDLPVGPPPTLAGVLEIPATPPQAREAALEAARRRRAERRLLAASRAQLDADIVLLGREALPRPTLFADLQREQAGQGYLGVGVSIPLPLFRRNQGELAAARAARQALDEEAALTAAAIDAEVVRTHRTAEVRQAQARLLAEEVVPAAEAGADLLRRGWQAGRFDLFRVIQGQREAWEARRAYLEAVAGASLARIELDRATGAP